MRIKSAIFIYLISVLSLPAQCWKDLGKGGYNNVAIKYDGTLWAWGYNEDGRLGDGTYTNRSTPIQIGTDSNWQSVSSYGICSFAIKQDGTLWAWGNNSFGQLGDGTINTRISPIQIGTDTNWLKISSSNMHTLAVKNDGTLWAWGYNYYGQVGNATTTNLLNPTQIGIDNNWNLISAGSNHSLAIKQDGTLWSWGHNWYGQLGDGSNINKLVPTQIGSDSNWEKINAGNNFSFAIKENGTFWGWGYNGSGILGMGDGGENVTVSQPNQIGTDNNWHLISAGSTHNLAIKQDGTLWGWGYNTFGQTGQQATNNTIVPTIIGYENNWLIISAGNNQQSYSLKQDGSLWGWGNNEYFQLGNGTNLNTYNPTSIICSSLNIIDPLDNKISIFPNPTIGILYFNTLENVTNVDIIDSSGRLLKTFPVQSNFIDVSTLNKGAYLLKIYTNNNLFFSKLIKE